jgi:hypothetical protein
MAGGDAPEVTDMNGFRGYGGHYKQSPVRLGIPLRISGEAKHHAQWRELTADEEAAAVAALRELAGGPG